MAEPKPDITIERVVLRGALYLVAFYAFFGVLTSMSPGASDRQDNGRAAAVIFAVALAGLAASTRQR